jgi:histidinol-phosphate aminotransferase
VDLLGRILPPYCFPTTSQEAVLRCLAPEAELELARRRERIIAERDRLARELPLVPGIVRVWPSAANFLLIEASDAPGLVARARGDGILLRDFSWDPSLPGCVRITVGSPEENTRLLAALRS